MDKDKVPPLWDGKPPGDAALVPGPHWMAIGGEFAAECGVNTPFVSYWNPVAPAHEEDAAPGWGDPSSEALEWQTPKQLVAEYVDYGPLEYLGVADLPAQVAAKVWAAEARAAERAAMICHTRAHAKLHLRSSLRAMAAKEVEALNCRDDIRADIRARMVQQACPTAPKGDPA